MDNELKILNKKTPICVKNGRGYEVKAKSKEAEVWLYEEIGDSFFGGISANQFQKDIKALGEVNKITLRINSPGGDVFDGIAIYNVLKHHKARIDVHVDGLAASIASVIAMAGNTIAIADNAMMMIHNAWTITAGNADLLREAAGMLEKVDGQIVKTYMTRAKDEQKIIDLMAAETWMTAEEAMEYGLADAITESMDIAAHFDLEKFKYRNIPQKSRAEPVENSSAVQKIAKMRMATQRIALKHKKGESK